MAQIKVDFITSGNPRESSLFGFWFCLCERACIDGMEARRGVCACDPRGRTRLFVTLSVISVSLIVQEFICSTKDFQKGSIGVVNFHSLSPLSFFRTHGDTSGLRLCSSSLLSPKHRVFSSFSLVRADFGHLKKGERTNKSPRNPKPKHCR